MNKYPNAKQLALSLVAYSSASIFGPLIVFGGIGLLLDRWLGTSKLDEKIINENYFLNKK